MEQCDRYLALLSAQLDNEITREEERELAQHLAQCPDCNAMAQQLAMIQTAFPHLEEIEAPEGFAQEVMDKIQAQEGQKSKVIPLFKRPQFRALTGLAACALLCVGLYQSGLFSGSNSATTGGSQSDVVGIAPASAGLEPDVDLRMSIASPDPQGSADIQPDAVAPRVSAYGMPGVGTSMEPTTPSADETGHYQVAGQSVSAVLTLSRLPDGAEELLGQEIQWITEEDGQTSALITGQQMQALLQLAQEQKGPSVHLLGQGEDEELCAVVLSPEG